MYKGSCANNLVVYSSTNFFSKSGYLKAIRDFINVKDMEIVDITFNPTETLIIYKNRER